MFVIILCTSPSATLTLVLPPFISFVLNLLAVMCSVIIKFIVYFYTIHHYGWGGWCLFIFVVVVFLRLPVAVGEEWVRWSFSVFYFYFLLLSILSLQRFLLRL